jgi:hypothetical protein
MPDDVPRPTALERLGTESAKGSLTLPFTFRSESERLEFQIELTCANIDAKLDRMIAHVKLLKKYMDRR